MLNTIRLKILAVTLAVLTAFAAAAGVSTYLVKQVVEEMESITTYHVPIAAHVANIDALTSEFELQLRRALAHAPLEPTRLEALRARHAQIANKLTNDGKEIRGLLERGVIDPRNDPGDRIILGELKGAFAFIDDRLAPFIRTGDEALAAIVSGELPRAAAAMASFAQYDDVFGKGLLDILQKVESLTLQSVTETNGHQLSILSLNGVLFVVAATLGLGLFLVLTHRMQHSLTTLLAGTKQVERGDLDVALRVTSRDEIGRLTEAFNHMVGQLQEKERVKETFGQYLDPRIVARLIEARGEGAALSERRPATLFFSDISGFSGIGEELTAGAMVNLLNSYFSAVTRPIRDQQGIIDKFIGDAVMAFWTSPFTEGDRHAANACLAALAQQEAIAAFRLELPHVIGLRRDLPAFEVRMGLATGEVVVGTIGSEVAKSYTVIGDVVNVASRLEGVNKAYGTRIIIDDATYRLAHDAIEARELDLLTVFGKTEPVRVYELACRSGELTPELARLHEAFATGLAAYRAGDWDAAASRFDECLALEPGDGPARVFAHRVNLLRATPPSAPWDGVWQHTEK